MAMPPMTPDMKNLIHIKQKVSIDIHNHFSSLLAAELSMSKKPLSTKSKTPFKP